MAVRNNGFHLLVTTLAFSLLVTSSAASRAVPVQGNRAVSSSSQNQMDNVREAVEIVADEFFHGKMDFEINRDYAGSGANNRHTPVPQERD